MTLGSPLLPYETALACQDALSPPLMANHTDG